MIAYVKHLQRKMINYKKCFSPNVLLNLVSKRSLTFGYCCANRQISKKKFTCKSVQCNRLKEIEDYTVVCLNMNLFRK